MTSQAIKDGMTKGQWQTRDLEDCPIICNSEYNIVSASVWCPDAQDSPNAQAICTAVNSTYGANIDPEKVPEMVSMLEEIHETICTPEFHDKEDSYKYKLNLLLTSAKLR